MKASLQSFNKIGLVLVFILTTLFAEKSFGQVIAWDFNGDGTQTTVNSTTTNANLNTSVISKGSGLSNPAGGNAFTGTFGAVGYSTSSTSLANAISAVDYLQFFISAKAGFAASLSTLDANFLRSTGNAPNNFQWQYSLDGFVSAGINIGSTITYTGSTTGSGTGGFTAATGTAQTQINLSGIPALQNVASGSTITIRIYGWGALNNGSTFALGNKSGNDLAIGGTLTAFTATATTTAITPSASIVYGTSSTTFTSTVSPNPGGGTVQFQVDGANVGSLVAVSGGIATLTTYNPGTLTVGSHTIRGNFSGNGTFASSTGTNTTLTITQKSITVSGITTNNKVYDGTTAATFNTASPTFTGVINSDVVTVSGVAGTFADKNVGNTKAVTISAVTLGGAGAGNYIISPLPTGTAANITQKPLTATSSVASKLYDATTTPGTLTVGTVSGYAGSETLTITPTATNYVNANVGAGKAITISYSLADGTNGGLASNYSMANFAATGAITARPLTITGVTNTKTYNGGTNAAAIPGITSGALQGTDVASFIEIYNNKNTGTAKPLTPSGTVSDGNGGANYTYTFTASNTGTINALALTVTASTNTKTYNATTNAAAVPTITAGALQGTDVAAFTETYDTKNAGTGKTLTPAGTVTDGNSGLNYAYTFVTNITGIINPIALTVTATTNTKTYNGTTSATAIPTSGALQAGDVANFTEAYSTKDVGTSKALIPAGTVTDGNSGNNYAYTFVNNNTGVITAVVLTYTANTTSRIYGSANPAFSGTVTGFVNSETQATATTGTLAFATTATVTSNVGSYSINGSGLTANNGNYTFIQVAGNVTALTITAAPLGITSTNQTKCSGTLFSFTGNEFTTAGLLNSDAVTSATLTSAGTPAAAAAGSYSIVPSAAAGTGLGNYTITYNSTGTLTVNQAQTASAGAALGDICKGSVSSPLGGSIGGTATSGTWSDGGVGGTFIPNAITLNATWTPPVTYTGTATLTLTTSGGVLCGPAIVSKTQVVDANCQIVTLTQPIAVTVSATKTDISCNGAANGTIIVSGLSAGATYIIQLNGTGSNLSGNTTFGPGTYLITASAANGNNNGSCTATVSLTITQPAAVTASIAHTDATCNGVSNGTINFTASGGTAPYSYTLGVTTQSSNSFTGLAAGTYSYSITDANSCTAATGSVTITQPAIISATNAHTNVSCKGTSNGTATITASGGTAPYSYTVTGYGTNSTGVFTGLPAGTYNYTVTDANNCTAATGSVIITEPATAVNGSITSQTNATCFGGNDGSVTVAGTGGTPGYTYSKDGTTYQGSGTFNGLAAGSYIITVKDNNGCTTTVPVTISEPGAVTGILSGSATICVGNSTNLNIAVTGSGAITGTLSDGTSFSGTAPNLVVSVSPTLTTIYTIATITNGTCAGSASGSATVTINSNTWSGVTSTDWNTGTNWSCGVVPNSSMSDVTIPNIGAGNYPVINATTDVVRNITIASGASVTTTSTGTLTITGTYTNSGTLTNNGTIVLNGTTQQSFPGSNAAVTAMNALEVNNAAGVLIDKSFTLSGVLTPTLGTITLGSNNITLHSDAALTARVAQIPTVATAFAPFNYNGTGRFIIEQFMHNPNTYTGEAVGRTWRLMTAPLAADATETIRKAWQNNGTYAVGVGTLVTGPGGAANGFDPTGNNNVSLKIEGSNLALISVPNTNTLTVAASTYTLGGTPANKGYFMFVRGDRNPGNIGVYNSNSTTLSTTGKLQTGDMRYVFPSASNTAGAFTMLPNPYASPVDFDKIWNNTTTTNILRTFFAWNPKKNLYAGGYVTISYNSVSHIYDNSDPVDATNPQTQDIQTNQTVYVQTTATTSPTAVAFDEGDKSGVYKNVFRPVTSSAVGSLRVNLFLANSANTFADGALVQYNADYSNNVDGIDAVKFPNPKENIALLRNGKNLSIERRNVISTEDTVFYNLWNTTQRGYRFEFTTSGFDQQGLTAFLEDSYLKTSSPVNLNGTTTVNFGIDSNAASAKAARFRIVFKPASALPVTFTSVKAYQQNSNINVEWKVDNEMSIKEYQVERSADGTQFSHAITLKAAANNNSTASYQWPDTKPLAGNNYYRISSVDVNGKIQYSNVVKVFIGKGKSQLMVYPNPVTDGNINVQLINQPKGIYLIKLMNKLGQVILTKQIEHEDGSSTETMQMSKTMAHGTYQLEISKPDNSKTNINVLY